MQQAWGWIMLQEDEDIIKEQAASWDWKERRKAASCRDAPPDILERLSFDEVPWVREAVAGNPSSTAFLLFRLSKDRDGFVRAAVALNLKAPMEVLSDLSMDEMQDFDAVLQKPRYLVKESVAKNPSSDFKALKRLTDEADEHVRSAVAANRGPGLTADLIAKLAADNSWLVRFKIASNEDTPGSILQKLADDRITDVRVAAASNPNTPADALARLACDRMWEVRREVASNPSTPEATLRELSSHWSFMVREAIAGNCCAPHDLLEVLSKDPDQSVSKAAAVGMKRLRDS
jgi:HEAT repeat protein